MNQILLLTTLLTLDRPLMWFDCETTGPNPSHDRIVSLTCVQMKPGATEDVEWTTLMNPEMAIPHEASHGNGGSYEGHGITDEMVKGAPTFRDLAPSLLRGFITGTDYGGFNIKSFDLPLMQAEFTRAGYPQWDYSTARILDGFRLWQLGEARTLTDAVARFLKRTHEGAHGSAADVRATIEVVAEQLRTFTNIPRDLAALHALAYPVDPNAIDPDGKLIWKGDVAYVNFGKKWRGKRLDMLTRSDLIWIAETATGMNPTVKQICRDCLKGSYPVRASEPEVAE